MEKRGGGVAGEGCPNTTSQRAEMEKEKARGRGEGSPGRQTAPPLQQKCDLPLGVVGRCGNPWVCSLFTRDGGFWEEKQEHREPIFSFLQLLTNISSPAAAVMKILGK